MVFWIPLTLKKENFTHIACIHLLYIKKAGGGREDGLVSTYVLATKMTFHSA